MSTKTTKKSVKKALGILKSLQDQMSTKNKEASLEDVLAAVQKEEAALEKKREKVQKRQEKVDKIVAGLKRNKKVNKIGRIESVNDLPEMTPIFKKIYDIDSRPVVTVCTVRKGKRVFEGWAICSDIENPRHKKGENIALKRVAEVLVTKKDSLPIKREDAQDILAQLELKVDPVFKSRCYWL